MAFEWSADTQAFRSNDGPLERLGIRQLDRYAIQAKIGEGGMGVVYRARDVELGRAVAIKLLLPGRAESAAVRRRFEREAEALAKLRHPNLLQVHAAGEVEGNPYLVTEWLEGEGFDERLEREGPFPPEEAAALVAQVALALAHAHERGVLHRDIKPTNVLLVPGRGPVLIDFGLAKDADPGASRLTASGVFAGTAGYAAPEQLVDASSVDGLADVYGLGATLYTLLTGEAPVGGATTFQELLALCAAGKVPPPSEVREGIPRRIDEAVQKAMAPMPAERFADAQALAVALAPRSSASSGPPRRGLGVALALVAAAFVGGALIVARSGDPRPAIEAPRPSPSEARVQWRVEFEAAGAALRALSTEVAARGIASAQDARAQANRLESAYALGIAALKRRLEAAPSGERGVAAWELGTLQADAGRWVEALSTLEIACADPAVRARAWLAVASVRLARDSPDDEDVERANAAMARAARAGDSGPRGEGAAVKLARAWLEALNRGSGAPREQLEAWISPLAEVIRDEEHPAPSWLLRDTWIVLGHVLGRAQGGEARQQSALLLSQIEKEAPIPYWSHVFTDMWTRSWGGERALLISSQLYRMELMFTHRPSLACASPLTELVASVGWLDALNRLAALPLEFERDDTLQRQRARSASEAQAGPISLELAGPGWASLSLPPEQSTLHVLVQVPAWATHWELRLLGARADLDLLVRHDGPPDRNETGHTRRGETMARDETLRFEAREGRPLTTGIHQVVIQRGVPWPEPIGFTLELRCARSGARVKSWDTPWAVTARNASEEARQVLPRARRATLAGRTEEAERLLAPHEARSPELVLIHGSMLAQAGEWRAVRQLERKGQRLEVRRALDFLAARAASALGEGETARAEFEALRERHPRLIAAHEELALNLVLDRRYSEAIRVLEALAHEDESLAAVRLLLATAKGLRLGEKLGTFRLRLVNEKLLKHVAARRLILRALVQVKPRWVPKILADSQIGAQRLLPERLLLLRALVAVKDKAGAKVLLRELEPLLKAAPTRRELRALAARLR